MLYFFDDPGVIGHHPAMPSRARLVSVLMSDLRLRGFPVEPGGGRLSGLLYGHRDQERRGPLPGRDEIQAFDLHVRARIVSGDDTERSALTTETGVFPAAAPAHDRVAVARRRGRCSPVLHVLASNQEALAHRSVRVMEHIFRDGRAESVFQPPKHPLQEAQTAPFRPHGNAAHLVGKKADQRFTRTGLRHAANVEAILWSAASVICL